MQIARSWRQQASNLRLIGSRCTKCETLDFPERIRCQKCGSDTLEAYQYSGFGTVFATSIVYEAPQNFSDHVPYLAALVKLDEGPMIATMLTDMDLDDAYVGMPVSMVTRRIKTQGDNGPIVYAYKFAPMVLG